MIFEVFNQNSKYYREMMDIIVASKVNPPEKGQVHHIVPRCWFKHYNMDVDNSISNTVLLTYENHKLVHTLAYKCAKEIWFKRCMAYAAHMMGDKEAVIKLSEETKKKISYANKGKKLTETTKKKMSESKKGSINGSKNPNYGNITTDFGKKYIEHYGHREDRDKKLYDKEYKWYKRNGKCRWE